MAEEKVAGFFASLKLLTDSTSFKRGLKAIKNVEKGLKSLSQVAKKAFAVGGGITAFTGLISILENKNYNTALSLGMTVKELKKFKYAAELANISGSSFIESLKGIRQSTLNLTKGELNLQQAIGLEGLGVGAGRLFEKDLGETIKIVFNAASKSKKDDLEIIKNIQMVLGEPGEMLYLNLKKSKKTLSELLTYAEKLQFSTNAESEDLKELHRNMRIMKIVMMELQPVFGAGFARGILPNVDWSGIADDPKKKAEMASRVGNFGEKIGKLVGMLVEKLPDILNLTLKVLGKADDFFKKEGILEQRIGEVKVIPTRLMLKKVALPSLLGGGVNTQEKVNRILSQLSSDIKTGTYKSWSGKEARDIKNIIIKIKNEVPNIKISTEYEKMISNMAEYADPAIYGY